MRRIALLMTLLCVTAPTARPQTPELKFIADTLVVQAEGTYETEPDLARLTFDISSQDKELKKAYDTATQSIQRIVALAERSGLKKEDVSSGTLTVAPSYDKDRRGKAKSYTVQGRVTLRVQDFSQIGPIMDGAVQDGIVDFRSLTYSLRDEEAAKQHAVAEAMRRAVGRATAALAEKGQKVGALRYASLDVRHLTGVARLEPYTLGLMQTVEVSASTVDTGSTRKGPSYLPQMHPEKITVSATVQCAFQIL